MLISYKNARMPFGLAISRWTINNDLKTFVLSPYISDGNKFVEIDCAIGNINTVSVMPNSKYEWSPIRNGFGKDAEGYTYPDNIRNAIYSVWDDGAKQHVDQSQLLYKFFSELIDEYTPIARDNSLRLASEKYNREAEEAKTNGWDVSIIERGVVSFPYLLVK